MIVPSNNYTLDITIEDYQGYFLPGGRKTTGISFAREARVPPRDCTSTPERTPP